MLNSNLFPKFDLKLHAGAVLWHLFLSNTQSCASDIDSDHLGFQCLSIAQCLEHRSSITLLFQGLWQNIYFYHYYQFLVKYSRVNVQH